MDNGVDPSMTDLCVVLCQHHIRNLQRERLMKGSMIFIKIFFCKKDDQDSHAIIQSADKKRDYKKPFWPIGKTALSCQVIQLG